jgi:hypothetical protein
VNALSNERKQVKVSILDTNIGGSYVNQPEIVDPEQKYSPTSSSVIVNSILMDDLVDVYKYKIANNKTSNQTISRKFVIKLDIEGYEPFVFEKSERFFKDLEIVAIFMEFGKMVEKLKQNDSEVELSSNYLNKINNMLRILKKLNYEPYEVNGFNKLDYNNWKEDWPWDVYFRNCDLINCPGHVYKLTGSV